MHHSALSVASQRLTTRTLGALVAITLLGLGLRLYGISTESLWLDEATSLTLARMDVGTLIEWTALDIHPPLYYALLHYWIVLGESELVVRGLSTLAGVVNLWVIYALGRALYGRRTGLLAACLLAVSPFHIWYSQEARMYAWITLWISASLLLALLVWRLGGRGRKSWLAWVVYVLAASAGLYTHYYGVFGIMLANLWFVYLLLRRRVTRILLWQWVGSQVAVLLLFAPWLPTFLLPITVGGGGWITMGMGRPSLAVLPQTAVLYMVGTGRALYPSLVRRLGYLLTVGLVGVGTIGIWRDGGERNGSANDGGSPGQVHITSREAPFFCLTYLVLPLGLAWMASQLFKPMYSSRYMLPFLIPYTLLLARGIDRLRLAWFRWAALLCLLVFMGIGVIAQVRLPDKPDWRGLAEQLAASAQSGDLVLFVPGWHAKPFAYYAPESLERYGDLPIPVNRYPQSVRGQLDELAQAYDRIWLVWEEGHYTDPDSVVYRYLDDRWDQVSSQQMPLLGRVILFAKPAGAGARRSS